MRLTALTIIAASSISWASAQEYFWFDDGGTILPEEGTVDALSTIVIDYSGCQGTAEGLNPANGIGKGWITSDNGNYNVSWDDNYTKHQLTLTIEGGPIVKQGDYKLTIPEGSLNVYGNSKLVNDQISYWYTVNGSKDTGAPTALTLVSSYPAEGETISLPVETLTMTFDQDITVSQSMFEPAGIITNLTSGGYIQLKMQTEGPVLKITKNQSYSSSDFMAGQSYRLDIYAGHVKSAADSKVTLPNTSISFKIAASESTNPLQVMAQIPAAGQNIRSAGSVKFNKSLTAVDSTKVSLANEKGHRVPLSFVGRDQESPMSLIFNIAEGTQLQPNTTYTLHLKAGAVKAGQFENDEGDVAYWCIPVSTFALNNDDPGETSVPEFSQMTVSADVEELTLAGQVSDIKVTGVMENAAHVYSVAKTCTVKGNQAVIEFEPVTVAMLEAGGALNNSVKVVMPQGMFVNSMGNESRAFNGIVYVIEEKEIGAQQWIFKPASGSTVEQLGTVSYAEEEDGTKVASYSIDFHVRGENVYANIKDASSIKLLDYNTGVTVRTFNKYDITTTGINTFNLRLGDTSITEQGHYELIIPKESVNLHSDESMRTKAKHPLEDVSADWIVGQESGIEQVEADAKRVMSVDLMGRRIGQQSLQGLKIENGRIMMH